MKKWLCLVIISAFIIAIAMTTIPEKGLTQEYSRKTQAFYENYKSH